MEENKDLIKLEERVQAIEHKDKSLKRLDMSFQKHIELEEFKKSNLLSYWITDFSNYHDMERTFDTTELKSFKRGDIIKVNLGFNLGHELGGLHYCIVLTKYDNPRSDTLNVIPLSSKKESKSYNKYNCVDLGDEIYNLINNKFEKSLKQIKNEVTFLNSLDDIPSREKINELSNTLNYLEEVKLELSKMKHGSIALISQITTISKIRIFNTKNNILLGIHATNKTLDLLDSKIMELFTKWFLYYLIDNEHKIYYNLVTIKLLVM